MKFTEKIIKTIDVVNSSYVDSNNVTQSIKPFEVYLVPIPSTTEHERYVADNNGVVSKQSSGSAGGGDFIPLSGTEPGKPLINPIQYVMTGTTDAVIYSGSFANSERRSLNIGSDNDIRIDNFSPNMGYHKVQVNPFNINMESWDSMYYNTGSIVIAPGNVGIGATADQGSGVAGINVSGVGVSMTGLTNAQGDATFTRSIVQKEDGSLGYMESPKYISLSGTEPNDPITGDLEVSIGNKIIKKAGTDFESEENDNYTNSIEVNQFDISTKVKNETSNAQTTHQVTTDGVTSHIIPGGLEEEVAFAFRSNGFNSSKDFSSNPNDLDYVQKKYVDSKVTGLYKIKGSVANYDTLVNYIAPYASVGDVYNTLDTGDNYVWVDNLNNTGVAGWDKLAGTMNVEGFIPLTGTKFDKPLVGPIQFAVVNTIKAFYAGNLGQRHGALVFKDEGEVNLISSISSDEDSKISIKKNFLELKTRSEDEVYNSNLSMQGSGVFISAVDTYNNRNALFSVDSSSGVTMTGLANATGDTTFTRQLVQKDDGTLGYETKSFKIPEIAMINSGNYTVKNINAKTFINNISHSSLEDDSNPLYIDLAPAAVTGYYFSPPYYFITRVQCVVRFTYEGSNNIQIVIYDKDNTKLEVVSGYKMLLPAGSIVMVVGGDGHIMK